MSGEISIRWNAMKLYNGWRSVYLQLTIGRRSWFVSRWDTARVRPAGVVVCPSASTTSRTRTIDLHRGALMTWYAGARRLQVHA